MLEPETSPSASCSTQTPGVTTAHHAIATVWSGQNAEAYDPPPPPSKPSIRPTVLPTCGRGSFNAPAGPWALGKCTGSTFAQLRDGS